MSLGELAVMGVDGDTRIMWDSTREAEVDVARETFARLRGQGYIAYAVSDDGGRDEVLREFDAEQEKIIMALPMRGG